MNIDYIQSLIYDDVKTVKIKFLNISPITIGEVFEFESKNSFTYKTKLNLKIGDKVICPVIDKNHIKIGKVVEVHDYPQLDKKSNYDYKWISQKVDQKSIDKSFRTDKKFRQELKRQQFEKEKANLEISDHNQDLLKSTDILN